MSRKFVHYAVVAALVVALAGIAPPAKAAVSMTSELVFQFHCSDAEETAHPKRFYALQPIASGDLARFEDWAFFAGYVGFPEVGAASFEETAGVKNFTAQPVLLKADGSQVKLGRFRARVARDGTSSAGKIVTVPLERGDVIEWSLTFKGSQRLPQGACLIAVMGYAQPGFETQTAAFSALAR